MIYIAASILVLLILSAFFSGSETALTAASRPLMHQMEKSGNVRASLINRLLHKKEKLIGSILLGNNLVNILASALATSLLMTLFGEAGVALATVGMTLLVLIFSEILPKTYAIRHANRAALAVAPLINAIVIVLTPFVVTINVIVGLLLRLFGVDPHATDALHSSTEELRGAIELHTTQAEGGEKESGVMMRSVLDLRDVQVGEIMTHRKSVTAINADDPPEQIITQVLECPYSRVPLWREDPDNVVGVLHAKALLREVRAHAANPDVFNALDIMTVAAQPWFVPEYTPLLDQLQAFRERREHFAMVVDEYGSLLGIVTLEDVIEEIVGDIDDETDETVAGVETNGDGTVTAQGDVTIRDLNRQFNWNLPDAEASTIAGLVLHESRRIPDVGQVFRFHGFKFEILRRHHHQIRSLRITPPSGPGGDEA
ncbi:MAG: HlyC/CorC family transporter [Alphaproteobacteria bacterium]|nr:HlyC/CorC family transporter [Alphaproteobacteria bacterium]